MWEAGGGGLLHVSELAHHRVANPADEVSEGREVLVKYIGIDEKNGKNKLSRKALIPKSEGAEAEGEAASHNDRPRLPRAPRRDR